MNALSSRGHNITVLTGRPSYAPSRRQTWRLFRMTSPDSRIKVITLGSSAFERSNLLGRVSNYVTFLALASLSALMLRKRDVVICGTDPPLAVLSAIFASRRRPLVYAMQDLHPDAAAASGILHDGPLVALWEAVHRWALRRCTRVVCLGTAMARRVAGKGVDPTLISVIRTGADAPSGDADRKIVDELRSDDPFVIVHAGNLGTAGPWEEIAEAASNADSVRFLFVGDGIFAQGLSSKGLEVRPFLDRSLLPSVMAAGDLQMVALKRGLSASVVPSKVYTAIGHGRPIFAVVPADSEVAEIVRDWDCGVVVEPRAEAIVAAATALSKDPKRMAQIESNARRAADDLSKERSLRAWISLIEGLT